MPSYYEYLVSSLPGLSFGLKPPLSSQRLISMCENLVSEEGIKTLRSIADGSAFSRDATGWANEALKRWRAFELMLKNEIAEVRAVRRKEDPSKYKRSDGHPASYRASHIAINAYRAASPIESERTLDRERWHELDDMGSGHYFDADALVIYALKLAILEKWERIGAADKIALLEKSLG